MINSACYASSEIKLIPATSKIKNKKIQLQGQEKTMGIGGEKIQKEGGGVKQEGQREVEVK